MRVEESTVAAFLQRQQPALSVATLFPQETFAKFLQFVSEEKEIAAAEEYQKVTGADIEECHLAAYLAKKL